MTKISCISDGICCDYIRFIRGMDYTISQICLMLFDLNSNIWSKYVIIHGTTGYSASITGSGLICVPMSDSPQVTRASLTCNSDLSATGVYPSTITCKHSPGYISATYIRLPQTVTYVRLSSFTVDSRRYKGRFKKGTVFISTVRCGQTNKENQQIPPFFIYREISPVGLLWFF